MNRECPTCTQYIPKLFLSESPMSNTTDKPLRLKSVDRQKPELSEFNFNESLEDSNDDQPKKKINNAEPKSFSSRDMVKSNYSGNAFSIINLWKSTPKKRDLIS